MLSKCFEQLGYVVSVFNHWIFLFCIGREANMWVCRLGSNVSGLCRSKLGCSWQDSLRIGVLTPSVLWVYVIFLIFVAFESSVVTSSEACTALDPQAILTNPPWFRLQWSWGIQIPVEVGKVGYRLTKLGINLHDFPRFHSHKTWYNEEYEQQWKRPPRKSKTWHEGPLRTIIIEKNSLVLSLLFSSVLFWNWIMISPLVSTKLGRNSTSLGYFRV